MNRLFEIVYILLQKKSVTSKELAERFNVSKRTIYRDVDTLSLAGIPVYTEQGKGGGISLLPDYVLNKSILSEQEQTEILSALQGLSNVTTAETNLVLQKLSAIFNKTAANWLEVDFSSWGFANGKFFSDFKTAILEHRIVEFNYFSSYGEKTHRRIEPVQLWFKSRTWYVKGFCLARLDIRLFKLTRVKDLTVTDEHFPERDLSAIRPSPVPDGHLKRDVTLKLKIEAIEPKMAYRVLDEFDEDMAEKQPDGSFIATVTFQEDEWLYGWILSFGDYIEVLEPEYIREIVKNKTLKTAKKYL